ncbi:sensory box sensor histidine kianse/response regulator [Oceanicola granulosus HTCC2516]|uniref:histidine kinase n=2 Tax=Oceanicola granulosus TaxID=252302 RepID=Q2CHP3_OCEGH|nr:sensory box sensor histidine kianse/response regulator [Oceanicola granulosus HTCC2516]
MALDVRPWAVLGVALAALAGSVLTGKPAQALGLQAGAALAATAWLGMLAWQAHGRRRLALRLEAAGLLIEHDPFVSFVTTDDGTIHARNAAARARFQDPFVDTLGFVLTDTFANPGAVLFRLQSRAHAGGHAVEEIVTRRGPVRLAVRRMGDEIYLWRLEEQVERTVGRGAEAFGLPMLTAGPTGTILYMNEAFRRLMGGRVKALQQVFAELPIVSGRVHRVQGVNGTIECIVAEINGNGGRREIYLIPGPGEADARAGPGWGAIDALPVPLLKVATDGTVIEANREARALLGADMGEATRLSDLLDGLGRPMADWLRDAARRDDRAPPEFLSLAHGAQDTFVQVALSAEGAGDDRHLIVALTDVTAFKSLEAQFVQSQKMQAIGQLAGGVAHDFNNLLTAISGHCDLLLLRHDQGDPDFGDLTQIHQNANRAAALVGQLLAFSRKQNMRPERLDLRDTLADLTHLLNRLVGEKIALTLAHDPALKAIRADKRQIEQVLMNLVVNARDAMPEGGEIRIETENLCLKQSLRRDRATVPAGEYVVMHVIDDGHGIAEDKRAKIFEPFFTTKRTGDGTGLGLSTAYGIVKQTGGYVFVDSAVGRGSTFTLFFPVNNDPPATFTHPPVAPAVERRGPEAAQDEGVILLVEDEAPVRAFASRALRLRGYTVLEADCAESALEILQDAELVIDVFVTDVVMPGLDGPTWVREALTERPDTRVVFVSGYSEETIAENQTRIPNSVFLPKPFSLSELTATVQRQLH